MKNIFKKSLSLLIVFSIAAGLFGSFNIFAEEEISGDSSIYLPPVGKTMKVSYSVASGRDDIVWSLSNNVEGVNIMQDGALIVTGGAMSGASFDIMANSSDGTLLGSKTVSILSKPEKYSDTFDRYFEDFEVFKNDNLITQKTTPYRSTIKYYAGVGTNLEVGKEADGNTYAKARGGVYWVNDGLARLQILKSWNDGQPVYMNGSNKVTFEGRFKAETPTSDKQALIFMDNAGIKLMYSSYGDQVAIYDDAVSANYPLAYVNENEWFNLRMELDHINQTFNVYLNDTEIITQGELKNNLRIGTDGRSNNIFIGASVDDIAMYNGELLVPDFPEFPEVVYLTEERNEAVIELETNLKLGEYEIENVLEYSGVLNDGDKLILGKGNLAAGTVSSEVYGVSKEFLIETADGLEYDFSDSVNIPDGNGTVADGKLDLTDAYAEIDLPDVKGSVLITYDLFNTDVVTALLQIKTDSDSVDLEFSETDEDGEKVTVVINTFKNSYIVILGGEIIGEGELAGDFVDSVKLSGGKADNFVFTSMCKTNPFVFNPVIKGTSAVGQLLEADYRYYSPYGADKISEDIVWYASETETGEYERVGEGKSFTPGDELVNKWVRFSVKATDSEYESNVSYSAPVKIDDVFSLELSGGNIKVEILNSLGVPYVYAITRLYSGNKLAGVKMNKVLFGGGSSEILESSANGADGAAVILIYPDSFKPVSVQKTAGQVPIDYAASENAAGKLEVKDGKLYISGEADDLASVVVYGHSKNDIFSEYSDVFERTGVFGKASDEESIVYASNIPLKKNKKTVVTLPELSRGAYRAEVVTRSGKEEKLLWMEKPEEIMNSIQMSEAGFYEVLKRFINKSQAELIWITDTYKNLSADEKEIVERLIKGENYSVEKFSISVSLAAYLSAPKLDGDAYKNLKTEFSSRDFDIGKIEALSYDASPLETKDAVFKAEWINIQSFIDCVDEKSILYGIYHVKNYREADTFLKKLNDTNYNQSKYKDNISGLVAGKLYNSIDELKTVIKNYKPQSGGTSSGGGGGGGGGSAGGSSSGGSSGGKSSVSQVVSAGEQPVLKNAYTDVEENHWANEAITYLKERKIVNGMPDGSFNPDGNITRAEFVKIVCEGFKLKSDKKTGFEDVKKGDWFISYVEVAGGLGIVNGSDGSFLPYDAISREDAAIIIYRIAELKGFELETDEKSFKDAESISDYAKSGIGRLYASGIINGMEDGCFCPENNMTRAECAKMVSDILRRYGI